MAAVLYLYNFVYSDLYWLITISLYHCYSADNGLYVAWVQAFMKDGKNIKLRSEEVQEVMVRFSNFPDQEFRMVNRRVSTLSLVPTEDNYLVEIAFPNQITTNYDICLPVSQEMKASAEIVTEDLRLIERFFQPLKKILKEGF